MAVLIGMSAEVKGRNFEIDRDKVSIGRNTTNLIAIDHPTVSGRHGCITRTGHEYVLADLGSTNGTRVNGKEVKECRLHAKDLVQIGSLEFMFDAEDAPEAPRPVVTKADTKTIEAKGAAAAPISFGSISPFGSRKKDNVALWYALIIGIGLLALLGVGFVIYLLLMK